MASVTVANITVEGAFVADIVAIKNVLKEEGKLLVGLDWIEVSCLASISFMLQLEAFVECFINKLLAFLKVFKIIILKE